MKKLYKFLYLLVIPTALVFYAFPSGSPGGYSGSPGDGVNCTDCHQPGPATEVEDWISTNIPPAGFIGGQTYLITVTGTQSGVVKMGFELTAEDESVQKSGLFTLVEPERTQLRNSNTAVTHTTGGTATDNGTNTWEVEWTAPTDAQGAVTFYAAVNATNNDDTNGGDEIFVSNHTVNPNTTGSGDDLLAEQLNIYPNPTKGMLNIDLPKGSDIQVVNINGQEVVRMENASSAETVDLTDLAKGLYFVRVSHEGNNASIKLIKE